MSKASKILSVVSTVVLTVSLFLLGGTAMASQSTSTGNSSNSGGAISLNGAVSIDIRPDAGRKILNAQEKSLLKKANSLKKYLPNKGKGVNIVILIDDAPFTVNRTKCNMELYGTTPTKDLLSFMKLTYARVLQCRTVKGDMDKYYATHGGWINSESIAELVAIKLGAKNVDYFLEEPTSEQLAESNKLLKVK